ncbi:hypothetical protein Btru_021346 [Bulinus truncatus]|nr:hypothetical protein Btru_021346 [Bulinus truncatus]
MQQDDTLCGSFQQALKIQQEERESANHSGYGPSDINFSTSTFSNSRNNATICEEEEEDMELIDYDDEILGAIAASPAPCRHDHQHCFRQKNDDFNLDKLVAKLSQQELEAEEERLSLELALKLQCEEEKGTSYNQAIAASPEPCFHNSQHCFRQNNDDFNLDKQVAKILQEEVEAEDDRLSVQLALKLQSEEEEKKVKRKSHNRGRGNFSTRIDRPRLACSPPPQRPRQNVSLLGRASSMRVQTHLPSQRNVGFNNTQVGAGFGYDDILVMQSLEDLSDTDVFLLPPGLQNFHSHPGQSHDFIQIPEDSNFEELLALTDSLGDVSCGLSESQISKLQIKRWSTKHKSNNCTICLSDYLIGDELRMLPCRHDFHRLCVDPWLKDKPNCPTCRADVKV